MAYPFDPCRRGRKIHRRERKEIEPCGKFHRPGYTMVGSTLPQLQTSTTMSIYFVERFIDKKLSKDADIPTFKIVYNPIEHI